MLFYFPSVTSGVVYNFSKFLVLCNDIQNVFREKDVPSTAKKSIGIKYFYSNHVIRF